MRASAAARRRFEVIQTRQDRRLRRDPSAEAGRINPSPPGAPPAPPTTTRGLLARLGGLVSWLGADGVVGHPTGCDCEECDSIRNDGMAW